MLIKGYWVVIAQRCQLSCEWGCRDKFCYCITCLCLAIIHNTLLSIQKGISRGNPIVFKKLWSCRPVLFHMFANLITFVCGLNSSHAGNNKIHVAAGEKV